MQYFLYYSAIDENAFVILKWTIKGLNYGIVISWRKYKYILKKVEFVNNSFLLFNNSHRNSKNLKSNIYRINTWIHKIDQ